MNRKFDALLNVDPKSVDGWELLGRLGQGGFGTIYIGRKGNVNAAIKMISRESLSDDESWQRFGNEIHNLKKLDHPNIAKIVEDNLSIANPYIAIEFIDGETLDSIVTKNAPLSEDIWLKYFRALLLALDHCHSINIIHKDLSPSNIVISEGQPKLIDFGQSFLKGSERLTQQGVVSGTPGYMSPEHYGGSDLSQEMDLFSLASVFAYAGTGRSPFASSTKTEYSNKTKYEAPDLTGLNANQVKILTPLFFKDPRNRPSIKDVLTAIDELSQDQSLTSYEYYLKNFDKKIIFSEVQNDHAKKKIKKLVFILVTAIVVAVGSILLFRSTNNTKDLLTSLTPAQLVNLSVCEDFALIGESEEAIARCEEFAEIGIASAQYSLGISWEKQGDIDQSKFWLIKAAEQQLPEALVALAYQEIEQKNYSQALIWAQRSADLGELDGINVVGISYGYLKQYDLAVQWYKKSWELGDVLGAINLGHHYRFDDYDKIEAAKWLKIAAENTSELFEGDTAFEYAEFLRIEMKNSIEACKWYEKSAVAQFKEDNKDGVAAFKKFCPEKGIQSNPVKSALLSSKDLKISLPLDPKVKISEIFGRVYKDSEMMWRVILTNSITDLVPPINGVQFRLIGYEEAGWISLPYKLKTDSNSVYAAVDDLFFAVLFKQPVCPEFRAVREENQKIVSIWTKGKPECSNDYVP